MSIRDGLREVRLRCAGYLRRKMLKMELPGRRKRGRPNRRGEGGHAGGWGDKGRCRGQEEMETHDLPLQPNGSSRKKREDSQNCSEQQNANHCKNKAIMESKSFLQQVKMYLYYWETLA